MASHTPGDAGDISQSLAAVAGKVYRIQFTVSGALGRIGSAGAAGRARPVQGGGPQCQRSVLRSPGRRGTGNDTIAFHADSGFNGSIDDAVVFVETSTCLEIGTHHFWLEPLNADGSAGPTSGPFNVNIR